MRSYILALGLLASCGEGNITTNQDIVDTGVSISYSDPSACDRIFSLDSPEMREDFVREMFDTFPGPKIGYTRNWWNECHELYRDTQERMQGEEGEITVMDRIRNEESNREGSAGFCVYDNLAYRILGTNVPALYHASAAQAEACLDMQDVNHLVKVNNRQRVARYAAMVISAARVCTTQAELEEEQNPYCLDPWNEGNEECVLETFELFDGMQERVEDEDGAKIHTRVEGDFVCFVYLTKKNE